VIHRKIQQPINRAQDLGRLEALRKMGRLHRLRRKRRSSRI
jgi:hypothetical protein